MNMEEMLDQEIFFTFNSRSTKSLVSFLKEIRPVPELSESLDANEEGIQRKIRDSYRRGGSALVISQIKENL